MKETHSDFFWRVVAVVVAFVPSFVLLGLCAVGVLH